MRRGHPRLWIEWIDATSATAGDPGSSRRAERAHSPDPPRECAVVAIPDEKWGERPKAFVTLAEHQTATEREIIAFCREHLARFKAPAAVEFGPLPKTSTGKIQKYVLRNREWAERDKRVN
jgi:acyl-CoA synthetase (AMP-forming)/AMP-acid ligase II